LEVIYFFGVLSWLSVHGGGLLSVGVVISKLLGKIVIRY